MKLFCRCGSGPPPTLQVFKLSRFPTVISINAGIAAGGRGIFSSGSLECCFLWLSFHLKAIRRRAVHTTWLLGHLLVLKKLMMFVLFSPLGTHTAARMARVARTTTFVCMICMLLSSGPMLFDFDFAGLFPSHGKLHTAAGKLWQFSAHLLDLLQRSASGRKAARPRRPTVVSHLGSNDPLLPC